MAGKAREGGAVPSDIERPNGARTTIALFGSMSAKVVFTRFEVMTDTIWQLQRRMEAAASALDFEQARRLRDRINLLRNGASAAEASQLDTSGLTRQQPGAMGLGTSQQKYEPPPGWKPPSKPDNMTTGRKRK